MEIIVQGSGVEYFTPDEITISINFNITRNTYGEALDDGLNSVRNFINNVLLPNNFSMVDMKTRSFVIREAQKYNELTRSYVNDGFVFTQNASIKFDYDKERLAKIMEQLPKTEDAPKCYINFNVKDEKECRRKILAKAYKDAELQAQAIAEASLKTLKYCAKVDFKPFTTSYVSETRFEGDVMFRSAAKEGAASNIMNTFTPEDIELTETLYCLWIAE